MFTARPPWSRQGACSRKGRNHIPAPQTQLPATQVRAQIAKDALSHPFQSASNIVNQALLAHLPNDAPIDALPKID